MTLNGAGLDELVKRDADMARAFKLAGRPPKRARPPGFRTLVAIIVNQQVSQHAGRSILGRLETRLGEITPETVLAETAAGLRACGLSRAKVRYARSAADAVASGALDLAGLRRLSDDEARARLLELKGIGPWSADIYLMFALGRPDIWPVGDLALRVAVERLLGLSERPSSAVLTELGERWRPWRSSAAVMLWHVYRHVGPAAL